MDALSSPVRRTRKETHTADMPLGQPDAMQMPEVGLPERGDAIVSVTEPLHSAYTQALLFAEEPVTILINKSPEKFAPLTVDCWCNGKGAEVMADGKWVEFGWLPVERAVTTKRKYVEILARSKHMSVNTVVGDMNEESPKNEISRSNSLKAQFSIIGDTSPQAGAWIQSLMREQA